MKNTIRVMVELNFDGPVSPKVGIEFLRKILGSGQDMEQAAYEAFYDINADLQTFVLKDGDKTLAAARRTK